jgi:hypothetical protein
MEEAAAWRRKGSPGVEEEEPWREEAQDHGRRRRTDGRRR